MTRTPQQRMGLTSGLLRLCSTLIGLALLSCAPSLAERVLPELQPNELVDVIWNHHFGVVDEALELGEFSVEVQLSMSALEDATGIVFPKSIDQVMTPAGRSSLVEIHSAWGRWKELHGQNLYFEPLVGTVLQEMPCVESGTRPPLHLVVKFHIHDRVALLRISSDASAEILVPAYRKWCSKLNMAEIPIRGDLSMAPDHIAQDKELGEYVYIDDIRDFLRDERLPAKSRALVFRILLEVGHAFPSSLFPAKKVEAPVDVTNLMQYTGFHNETLDTVRDIAQ